MDGNDTVTTLTKIGYHTYGMDTWRANNYDGAPYSPTYETFMEPGSSFSSAAAQVVNLLCNSCCLNEFRVGSG